LLARGLARQKEIGMRLALGASRWRIVRQLMTENLILGVLGAAGGMAAGYFGGKLMLSVMAAPPGLHVVMDWRMVITGIVVALFTLVAFGLAPAWQAVRKGPRVTRAKSTLVAVQVAASCVLLIVSTMLTRSATRLDDVKLRFDDRHTLTVNSRLGAARLAPELARRTSAEIEARLAGLPGVDAVTAFTGRERRSEPSGQSVYWSEVGPAYFRVMNLQLLRGQAFAAREKDAAVVSESLARAMWPGQDSVGQILESQGVKRTVVGVVANSGLEALDPGSYEAYAPMSSTSLAEMYVVHTPADPRVISGPVRLAATVPGVAPYVASLWDSLDLRGATGQEGTLVRMLGATATALAFAGIFGLVTFAIAQRTGELALRIALGARPVHILRAIARPYAFALGTGACAGAGLAAAAGQILREQLHGLPPLDPLSFMAGVGMLGVVAVVAILSPARRALRINPAAALRSE
jgi:predicted permease